MNEQLIDLTRALRIWAKRNNITPANFRDSMGWHYNHAYRMLKGSDPFTEAAWGRFIRVYGMDALTELFRIEGRNPNPN